MPSLLRSLLSALHEVARAENLLQLDDEEALVSALHSAWPRLDAAARARWHELAVLFDALPPDDPLLLDESLLGIVGGAERETLHTQVLGSLLAPERSRDDGITRNPIARRLLSALIAAAGVHLPGSDDLAVHARVEAVLDGAHEGRRLDVLVEFGEPCEHRLVIENKIRARAGDGQLRDYASWAKRKGGATLIFLSPTPPRARDKSAGWVHLSYAKLAPAFRRVLSSAPPGIWRDFLRLYLASIVQDVLRYPRTRERALKTDQTSMVEYLRAATERQ